MEESRPEGQEKLDPSADPSVESPDDAEVIESPDDADADVVVARPLEARPETGPRGPLAVAGTAVVGLGMGAADVVPGFSGGTVALVAGIYERLIANVRQGAHVLSLLARRRSRPALQAVLAIEWPFVIALLVGIGTSIVLLASTLGRLLEERPIEMSAAFLGLVLGAAIVAQRELRSPRGYHLAITFGVAGVTFAGLGFSSGAVADPAFAATFGAGAVAVSAMILPGVSGAFLLVLLGMYEAMIAAVRERDILTILTFGLGCVAGLAAFSTLLNWLLRRYHDVVLAALIGLMIGSVRVLWPWPADAGFGDPRLGRPEGSEALLALSFGLAAFGLVMMLGLLVDAVARRRVSKARP